CNLSLPVVATNLTGRNCNDASLTVTPTGNCQPGNLLLQKRNTLTGIFESVGFVNIPAGQSHTFANLGAGEYNLNFTENGQYGCANNRSWFIAAPNCNLSLPVVATNLTGRNCNDASLTVTPTGNCQPGVLLLLKRNTLTGIFEQTAAATVPAGQSHTFGNLGGGEYNLNFTESGQYGCAANRSWFIAAPNCAASAALAATATSSANCTDGTLACTLAGICKPGSVSFYRKNSLGQYVFVENKPVAVGSPAVLGGLPAGDYAAQFVETGTFLCGATQYATIAAPACSLRLNQTVTHLTKRLCNNGAIKITPSGVCQTWTADLLLGGSIVATKTGTPGQSATFDGLEAADYQIAFTESGLNGCDTLQAVSVTQPDCSSLSQTVTILKQPKLGCQDGKIRVRANGICGNYYNITLVNAAGYLFTGVFDGTNTTFSNLEAGAYTAILTETVGANPCIDSTAVTLTSACTMTQTITTAAAPGSCPGLLRTKLSGLNCYAQATVTWTNTTTNESGPMAYNDDTYIYEANVPAGTYTVTATYGQCAITGTATVAAGACNLGLTATVNASGECDYNSIAISSNTCDSVLFELLNAQGAVLSTRTLAGGESGSFDDLSVGAYSVRGTRGSCTQTLARSISCPKPTSSYHEIVSSSSVVLYWQNFYCATGYTLQYRKTGTTAWTTVNINTNTSSRTLNNLMAGTDYEWRVRTRCVGNSFSAYSSVWTFSTPANRPATQRDSHTQSGNRTAAEPQLFPNPAGEVVELRWQNPTATTVEITVNDLHGQTALQTTAPVVNGKLATRLDISRLAPGAYFVRLNAEGADAQTLKVVKQ
ncbi:MAG: T9SS type A sorting domain-containing protein, partial [Saprospiraceae bacterium]